MCWLRAISAVLAFVMGISGYCFADYPQKMNFRNVMASQDVALGEVEAITQDAQGFMWFGGRNALLRFDGYNLLNVQFATGKAPPEDRISISQVTDLLEDRNGLLWVVARTGIYVYDRSREVLNQPGGNEADLTVYRSGAERIVQLPSGTVVLGSQNGLHLVDPNTFAVSTVAKGGDLSRSLPSPIVHDLYVDEAGVLWIGTDAGLSKYDEQSSSFKHYTPFPEKPSSLPDNAVWTLDQDHNGQLWLGVHKGIYRFDIASEQFSHRYLSDSNDRGSISGDLTRDIFVDSQGWVWTGNDLNGISLYDAGRDRFINFTHDPNKPSSLSANSIRRFFEDSAGDMWVGTYPSGVNFYDRSSAAITVYNAESDPALGLISNEAAAIVEDKDGNLWIGSGGVTKFDRANNTFTHYNPGNGKMASGAIISGLADHDGDIWFGTWAGSFFRYNAAEDRFDQMPFDATLAQTGLAQSDVLNDSVVWDIYQDKRGGVWVATHNGGLSRYDKKTGKYTVYEANDEDPGAISNRLVWTSFEDSKGRFWVGTPSGLNLMDREKGTFKKYRADGSNPNSLSNNSVLSIYEDSQNRLWFGTDAGLHLYRESSDDFERFGTQTGFVDQGIRSITQDNRGQLWMGTNNGVVVFNPDTQEVNNYKSYNGEKIGGFITGSALTTSKGEVVLGGRNGLRIFNIDKLGRNEHVPPVVITDFRIFTKSVPVGGPEGILESVINQTESITLDYTKTMFSFRFAALNFRDPGKNQYAYKLEGFDDNWREVGDQRSALYTNLNAGNYTFRVRASNNDGVWNEQGTAVVIKQLPPPWRTWWAHTLYALAVLAVIVQFVRSQRRKRRMVEEQNRILEARVAERTSELRAKNNDIQAMLSNMRQGLFTVEANGKVHSEYSKHLEAIFERADIAGADAIELLLGGAHLGSNTINQTVETMKAVIGEDEMNFTFNAHLLPLEYQADFTSGTKFLALDWNPIIEDDVVTKLMVSVRDVTQLKQMESEAAAKKRELDVISQLLNVPAKKYQAFAKTAKDFIAENRDKIRQTGRFDADVVALLFRNMHTIKGNCRTFGFTYFSDVVHDVESAYSDLKAADSPDWQQEPLLNDLERVEKILAEYENVYYTVLGRGAGESAARDNNGFWADSDVIDKIKSCIDRANAKYPDADVAAEFAPVTEIIKAATANPLDKVLGDIVKSLPSIADQLGKRPPEVVFKGADISVKPSEETLLNNVYAHILRNCVDHGIESPEERTNSGKPESGSIVIESVSKDGKLYIDVFDDGRGLNVQRLFTKGIETGKWSEAAPPSFDELAQLIFDSGVSTKDVVSDISGRGVGMDAVKQFLKQRGGDIYLTLVNPPTTFTSDVFIPFKIRVELPDSVCQ